MTLYFSGLNSKLDSNYKVKVLTLRVFTSMWNVENMPFLYKTPKGKNETSTCHMKSNKTTLYVQDNIFRYI